MKIIKLLLLLLTLFLGFLSTTYAQEPVMKSAPPDKIVLKGEWSFTNSSTGRHYGGDVEIRLGAADESGVYHGKISYDGRQTSQQCSTRSGFSPHKPVDARAVRVGDNYRVSFIVNCAIGPSPRSFDWELVHGPDRVYTRALSNANGSGMLSVKLLQ